MFDPGELAEPIVQAPLAGGPSTPALAIAVCEAGGLGFLAAGYKQPDAVREEIDQVRARTERPFGVNVFVPAERPADPATVRAYLDELLPEAARQGAELGEPRFDDDGWVRKLGIVLEQRPAVVSFAFGCPPVKVIEFAAHEALLLSPDGRGKDWLSEPYVFDQVAKALGRVIEGLRPVGDPAPPTLTDANRDDWHGVDLSPIAERIGERASATRATQSFERFSRTNP